MAAAKDAGYLPRGHDIKAGEITRPTLHELGFEPGSRNRNNSKLLSVSHAMLLLDECVRLRLLES